MRPPSLIEVLPHVLVHYGITLDQLRVYSAPAADDPDLNYCVTWGVGRYAAGTLRWWTDIQRLGGEPARLYDRHEDWRELIATIGCVEGDHRTATAWVFTAAGAMLGRLAGSIDRVRLRRESDESLRSRIVTEFGGHNLEEADDDPRAGLVEELPAPLEEPRNRLDRLLDDDDLV